MSVLITGGAGYIGSHTVVELLNAGFEVVVVDNLYNSSDVVIERIKEITNKNVTFYHCDVTDYNQLKNVFELETIEAVIHFAAYKAVGESVKKPLMYYQNNLNGLLTTLQVMNELNVKTFVFSSSATVYGPENPSPYYEHMKIGSASSPYGATKIMSEQILNDMYRSDNEWQISILRYFNPVGAHQSGLIGEDPTGIPNNLMPFISQVAIGKRPQLSIFGDDYNTPDGTCERDYIHVVDLAKGHTKALQKVLTTKGVSVYNLGSGKGTSVKALVDTFVKVNDVAVPYEIGPRREGDLDAFYANADKAKAELNWQTELTLEDMCQDTWHWQQKNPNGFNQ